MNEKILVVDDDPKIVELVKAYLKNEGYQVLTAFDGKTALRIVRESIPDLVILDIMLPHIGGFDVCRILRSESQTPIIMLTARDEETDKVIGLGLGADDYVTKPFSTRELVARVKAVLRRTGGESEPEDRLVIGDLVIDFERYEVRQVDQTIELTPTEFKLLQTMARSSGRVFTRLQLLDAVQGYTFEGYERSIDAHIKNLRRKLEPDPKNPRYILTVFGIGYKFAGDSHA
ncbi:MAG: response regulator [Bacillota bacterium]